MTNYFLDLEEGIDTAGGTITLNEQFDKYMNTKIKMTISTKENCFYMWNKDVRNNPIGNKSICNIKKSDVLVLYASLSTKGYKNGTIRILHNMMSPALQLAVDDDLIRKNPCKGCMADYSEDDSDGRYALTIVQQQVFLDFIRKNKNYSCYYDMIVIMIKTAVRRGETIGLTWNDIDMKNRIIKTDYQLLYKK